MEAWMNKRIFAPAYSRICVCDIRNMQAQKHIVSLACPQRYGVKTTATALQHYALQH